MSAFTFNLWTEPWIRIARSDGILTELSIFDCLASAHELGALSDPSPLVVTGTHRLLAAILQSLYDPQNLGDLDRLLKAGRFDVERLDELGAQFAYRFDLFHPTEPFLQTGDIALADAETLKGNEKSPISRLFAEIPTATNRTLFQHVTDDSHSVCPACCARGLIVIPSFASSGGPGIRPSINGVPPVYVLPAGRTLFETLTLSLMIPGYVPQMASPERISAAEWNRPTTIERGLQVAAVGYVESLVFPARRLRFFAQQGPVHCSQCGKAVDVYVREIFYEMGHWMDTKSTGSWDDPFVAFRLPQKDGELARSIQPREGKVLWREFGGLFLATDAVEKGKKGKRPKVISQLHNLVNEYGAIDDSQTIRTRCIWLRTDGKAKILEWGDDALEAPAALLKFSASLGPVENALDRAEEVKNRLRKWFGIYSAMNRRAGAGSSHFVALRSRMEAAYWQVLAAPFRKFVSDLATTYEPDDETRRNDVTGEWDTTLFGTGKRVFQQAVDQFGSHAAAIRARVEAPARLQHEFDKLAKEWEGKS